jgi:hypothetical protein
MTQAFVPDWLQDEVEDSFPLLTRSEREELINLAAKYYAVKKPGITMLGIEDVVFCLCGRVPYFRNSGGDFQHFYEKVVDRL